WRTRSGSSTTIRQQTEAGQDATPAGAGGGRRVPLGRAGVGALVLFGPRPLGQAVDQSPDLAVRVPAVPAKGADKGQLALLGPPGHGFGRDIAPGRGMPP